MHPLDWFQRERENWKEIEDEEYKRNMSWKVDEDDRSPQVEVEPILVDPLTVTLDEYGHMVHRGATPRAMELALESMTTHETEMMYLLLDSFGNAKNTRYSLPQTTSKHFYVNEQTGRLSAQFDKMNFVPGSSLIFMQALQLVWMNSQTVLLNLMMTLFTVMAGWWADYIRNTVFGGATLNQWKLACIAVITARMVFVCKVRINEMSSCHL